MSKYQLMRTVQKELKDLNFKIDMKIVKGISYRNEARRHKLLLAQMRHLSRAAGVTGFFTRMSGAMALFTF